MLIGFGMSPFSLSLQTLRSDKPQMLATSCFVKSLSIVEWSNGKLGFSIFIGMLLIAFFSSAQAPNHPVDDWPVASTLGNRP